MSKTKFLVYKSIDREGIVAFDYAHVDYISNKEDVTLRLTSDQGLIILKFDPVINEALWKIIDFFAHDRDEYILCISPENVIISDSNMGIDKLTIVHKEYEKCFITLDFALNIVDIQKVIDEENKSYGIDFQLKDFISNIRFKSLDNLNQAFDKIIHMIKNGIYIIDLCEYGYDFQNDNN